MMPACLRTVSRPSGRTSQTGLRWTKPLTSWRRISGMWSPKRCVKQLHEPAPVAGLLVAHAFEDGGGGGVVFAQAVDEIGVDALVFLFQGDGQGEDFALGEAVECAHKRLVAYFGGEGAAGGRRASGSGVFFFSSAQPQFLQLPFERCPVFTLLAAFLPLFLLQRDADIVRPPRERSLDGRSRWSRRARRLGMRGRHLHQQLRSAQLAQLEPHQLGCRAAGALEVALLHQSPDHRPVLIALRLLGAHQIFHGQQIHRLARYLDGGAPRP